MIYLKNTALFYCHVSKDGVSGYRLDALGNDTGEKSLPTPWQPRRLVRGAHITRSHRLAGKDRTRLAISHIDGDRQLGKAENKRNPVAGATTLSLSLSFYFAEKAVLKANTRPSVSLQTMPE